MGKKRLIMLIAAVLALGTMVLFMAGCSEGSEEAAAEKFYYTTGDAFVLDIPGVERFVKTTITMGMCRDETDMLTEKNAVVRDCILNVLRHLTEEDCADPDLQAKLSERIVAALNEAFPPEAGKKGTPPALFTRAYFSDFVMQ